MKRTLQVYVGNEGRLVGTLHYDQNGARERAAFVSNGIRITAIFPISTAKAVNVVR